MKKLSSSLFILTLVTVVFVFSSFTNSNYGNANGNGGNNGKGNVVTIDNGKTWGWIADNCIADVVPSTSARIQWATNGFANVTVTFQLPEGHCDIPEKGATVTHYDENSWAIINSNGKVTAKIVYNPNDN